MCPPPPLPLAETLPCPLSKHGTPSDRRLPDFQRLFAQGKGVSLVNVAGDLFLCVAPSRGP